MLHKAFDLLDALQTAEGAKSLDQFVRDTSIARSTAHRLLLNLIGRGYVERTNSGKFALGLKLLELGAAVRQHQSLRDIARPIMLDLRNRLGETINLGKLERSLGSLSGNNRKRIRFQCIGVLRSCRSAARHLDRQSDTRMASTRTPARYE